MLQKSVQDSKALARALLDVVPKLSRRVHADVPFDSEPSDTGLDLRDVSELRATPGQLLLLQILVERKRCTMQELAEHLGVAPSTVTAMVKRLLAQGYVERSRDDVDWRSVWVKPTERGCQVVRVYNHARCCSLQRRLDQLSEEEHNSLVAALPALRHLIEVEL
jgi:DNA-binding MarR family transcriptional regulator